MSEVELGDDALRRREAIALLDPVGEHAERRHLRRGERDGHLPALAGAVAGGFGAGNAEGRRVRILEIHRDRGPRRAVRAPQEHEELLVHIDDGLLPVEALLGRIGRLNPGAWFAAPVGRPRTQEPEVVAANGSCIQKSGLPARLACKHVANIQDMIRGVMSGDIGYRTFRAHV